MEEEFNLEIPIFFGNNKYVNIFDNLPRTMSSVAIDNYTPYRSRAAAIEAEKLKLISKQRKQDAVDWEKNKAFLKEYSFTDAQLLKMTPWLIADEVRKIKAAPHPKNTAQLKQDNRTESLHQYGKMMGEKMQAAAKEAKDLEAMYTWGLNVPVLRSVASGALTNTYNLLGDKEAANLQRIQTGANIAFDGLDLITGYKTPKSLATSYIGDWTGGAIGALYGHENLGRFAGALTGGFTPQLARSTYNYLDKVIAKNAPNLYAAMSMNRALDPSVIEVPSVIKFPSSPMHERYRLGDVEINDPNLNYRLGNNGMVDDFYKSGLVRVKYNGSDAEIRKKIPGKLLLVKSFNNPMFKQGGLWYDDWLLNEPGATPSYLELLVTRLPLLFATKNSNVSKFNNGGRRIPYSSDLLNPSNTTGYIWENGYGFRKFNDEPMYNLDLDFHKKKIIPLSTLAFSKFIPRAMDDTDFMKEFRRIRERERSYLKFKESESEPITLENHPEVKLLITEAKNYWNSPERKLLNELLKQEAFDEGYLNSDPVKNLWEDKSLYALWEIIEDPVIEIKPYNINGPKGSYDPNTNIISLYTFNESIPYHEGIHAYGAMNYLRGLFSKKMKQYSSASASGTDNFRRAKAYKITGEPKKDFFTGDISFREMYRTDPDELVAYGLQAGRELGIKPFAPMPEAFKVEELWEKAKNIVPHISRWTGDISIEDKWKILTGTYLTTVPFILNKNEKD